MKSYEGEVGKLNGYIVDMQRYLIWQETKKPTVSIKIHSVDENIRSNIIRIRIHDKRELPARGLHDGLSQVQTKEEMSAHSKIRRWRELEVSSRIRMVTKIWVCIKDNLPRETPAAVLQQII